MENNLENKIVDIKQIVQKYQLPKRLLPFQFN